MRVVGFVGVDILGRDPNERRVGISADRRGLGIRDAIFGTLGTLGIGLSFGPTVESAAQPARTRQDIASPVLSKSRLEG
ncbi:hypothetical protein [Halosolutus gelatinilyticus]|uniref:hypothetical protein n=1 Tax=Halosolutus gelatinilyticus TaxID=2931975 RepID=UPI001FF29183|nr:hypothetical protein [Halosolutus gelatinilyticus]